MTDLLPAGARSFVSGSSRALGMYLHLQRDCASFLPLMTSNLCFDSNSDWWFANPVRKRPRPRAKASSSCWTSGPQTTRPRMIPTMRPTTKENTENAHDNAWKRGSPTKWRCWMFGVWTVFHLALLSHFRDVVCCHFMHLLSCVLIFNYLCCSCSMTTRILLLLLSVSCLSSITIPHPSN
jgi:hypothetical protein